jgi:hypothetical protein
LSLFLHGLSGPICDCCSSSHSFHNHRRRRALANFPKCRIPSPPESLGLVERGQFTLHLPPVNASDPTQRNCFRLQLISFSVAFGARKELRYTIYEVRTDLTRVMRPAWLMCRPFQKVSLFTALSMRGWKSTRLSVKGAKPNI